MTAWLPGLARQLVADGLIDAAGAVDGEIVLRDASSRNLNAIVSQPSGPGLFVKRGMASGPEAAAYRRLRAVPGLSAYLPTVRRSDPHAGLLILAVERGAEDLWARHRREGRFPAEVGREVGRALGALHLGTRLAPPRPAAQRSPDFLDLHRPPVESLRELSAASLDLVATLQRHPSIPKHLEELRAGWREEALIHSDVKWPNIVAVPGEAQGAPSLRLVDWEHATEGDPAWDVGSAVAAYLSFWLSSIRARPQATALDLAAAARYPLATMRPAIRACWEGYLAAARVPAGGADDLLARTAAWAAVRLIVTAFEHSEHRNAISPLALLHLQVAANMLDAPPEAAFGLLGLGPR